MKRIFSLFTLTCFLISCVFGEALHALVPQAGPAPALEDLVIPSSTGRITGGALFGSRQIVLCIQDLHCHPEVQQNIAAILSSLDSRYKLGKVYVEGGYGDVRTSWLCDVGDAEVRKEILDSLVRKGMLTGSEYYSVAAGRPGVLKGIEDEALHKANIVRLGKILEKKALFEKKLNGLDKELSFLKAKYFGSKNRNLDRLIERHKTGELASDKFYALLEKYVETIGRDPRRFNALSALRMDSYPNVRAYLELSRLAKRLDYERITRQLPAFMRVLKARLPYSVYNSLLEKTGNFSRVGDLYVHLSRIVQSPELQALCRQSFPDLALFLAYAEKNRSVNPVALVGEERRLEEDLRIGLSRDIGELEVSFLADYYGYFKAYLLNELSADDYAYFKQRFPEFRSVWDTYADSGAMDELSGDFALLNEFYESNCLRNECFIRNIPVAGEAAGTPVEAAALEPQEIVRSLDGRELVVVVAGGFHTGGLCGLLRERRVSCLVVTPNVTQDTGGSDAVYAELAERQARLFGRTAIAPALGSMGAKVIEARKDRMIVEIHGERVEIRPDAEKGFTIAGALRQIKEQVTVSRKAAGTAAREFAKIVAMLQGFTNPLASAELIFELVKVFARYGASKDLFGSNGLIFALAKDRNVLKAVEDYEGVSSTDLAGFPEMLQYLAAGNAADKARLHAFARTPLSAALVEAVDNPLVAVKLAAVLDPAGARAAHMNAGYRYVMDWRDPLRSLRTLLLAGILHFHAFRHYLAARLTGARVTRYSVDTRTFSDVVEAGVGGPLRSFFYFAAGPVIDIVLAFCIPLILRAVTGSDLAALLSVIPAYYLLRAGTTGSKQDWKDIKDILFSRSARTLLPRLAHADLGKEHIEQIADDAAQSKAVKEGYLYEYADLVASVYLSLKSAFPKAGYVPRDLTQFSRFIRIYGESLGLDGAFGKGLEFIFGGRLDADQKEVFGRIAREACQKAAVFGVNKEAAPVDIVQQYLDETATDAGDDPSIPDLEQLDPVYTGSLRENMEAAAMAAKADFALLFEGITALGKSFAIKVLAALKRQPIETVGMSPVLTSYEILGGCHPSLPRYRFDEARALLRQIRDAADGKNAQYTWDDIGEALEMIGVHLQDRSAKEFLAGLLDADSSGENDRDIVIVLVQYLEGGMAGLEWRDGFLVSAMKEGKWLVFEELNLAPTEVLEVLNLYLVHKKILVTKNGIQEEVAVDPRFRLFATMNPEHYAGRQPPSEMLLGRFVRKKVGLSRSREERELTEIVQRKTGLDAEWSRRLVQAHFQIVDASKTWRSKTESREAYEFNLRHILETAQRLKALGLESPARKELAKALAGIVGEVYGDCVASDKGRDELFGILDSVFTLRAFGVRREEIKDFYPSAPVVPVTGKNAVTIGGVTLETGPGDARNVPGEEHRLVPVASTVRAQSRMARCLTGALRHILLTGPTAASKTSLIFDLYRQLQRPIHYVNMHDSMDHEALIGGDVLMEKKGKNGVYRFQPGPLVTAMVRGEALFVDEMNLSEMPEWFNTVLDDGVLWVSGLERPVRAKEGFVIIGARNPASTEGRKAISPALRSRFHEIWVPEITDPKELEQIVADGLDAGDAGLAPDLVSLHLELRSTYPKMAYDLRTLLRLKSFVLRHRKRLGLARALYIGLRLHYAGPMDAKAKKELLDAVVKDERLTKYGDPAKPAEQDLRLKIHDMDIPSYLRSFLKGAPEEIRELRDMIADNYAQDPVRGLISSIPLAIYDGMYRDLFRDELSRTGTDYIGEIIAVFGELLRNKPVSKKEMQQIWDMLVDVIETAGVPHDDDKENTFEKEKAYKEIIRFQASAGLDAEDTLDRFRDYINSAYRPTSSPNRDRAHALVFLAEAEAAAGSNAETVEATFDKAEDQLLGMNAPRVARAMAEARIAMGMFDEAKVRFGISSNDSSILLIKMAKAQAALGLREKAKTTFEDAKARVSSNPSLTAILAGAELEAGFPQDARKTIGEISAEKIKKMAAEEQYGETLADMAKIKAQAGLDEEARAIIDALPTLRDKVLAWTRIAEAEFSMGRRDDAEKTFDKALKMIRDAGPLEIDGSGEPFDKADALLSLAVAQAESGLVREARKTMDMRRGMPSQTDTNDRLCRRIAPAEAKFLFAGFKKNKRKIAETIRKNDESLLRETSNRGSAAGRVRLQVIPRDIMMYLHVVLEDAPENIRELRDRIISSYTENPARGLLASIPLAIYDGTYRALFRDAVLNGELEHLDIVRIVQVFTELMQSKPVSREETLDICSMLAEFKGKPKYTLDLVNLKDIARVKAAAGLDARDILEILKDQETSFPRPARADCLLAVAETELAMGLDARGTFDQAEKAIEDDSPSRSQQVLDIVKAELAAGMIDEAKRVMKKRENLIYQGDSQLTIAQAEVDAGFTRDALEIIEKNSELHSQWYSLQMAAVKVSAGLFAEAEAIYEAMPNAHYKDQVSYLTAVAKAKMSKGLTGDARAAFKKAEKILLDHEDWSELIDLAVAESRSGLFADAVQMIDAQDTGNSGKVFREILEFDLERGGNEARFIFDEFRKNGRDVTETIRAANEHLDRSLYETSEQGSDALRVRESGRGGTVLIGEAEVRVREAVEDERARNDIPDIEKLAPVYTPNLVDTMETAAFSADSDMPLMFDGKSAVGKSFAIKVVAALIKQPLVSIAMHGALSSYEAIGGYRPRVKKRSREETVAGVRRLLGEAETSSDWDDLRGALAETGILLEPDAAASGVRKTIEEMLADPAKYETVMHALLDVHDGERSNLVWGEGFLITAMREGKWLVLEEINLAPTEVLELLNLYLTKRTMVFWREGRQVELSKKNGGIHKDFRLFATRNPESMGGGRQKMSEAFLSRFVRQQIDLSPEEQENEWREIFMARFGFERGLTELVLAVMRDLLARRKTWIKGASAYEKYEFNLRHLLRLGKRLKLRERLLGTTFAEMIEQDKILYLASELQEVFGDMLREKSQVEEFWQQVLETALGLAARGITKEDVLAVHAPGKGEQRFALYDELKKQYGEEHLEAVLPSHPERIPVLHISDVDLLRGPPDALLIPEVELAPVKSTLAAQGKLARSLLFGEDALFVGPTGPGKTSLILDLFRQLNRSIYYHNMNASADMGELVGSYHASGPGEYTFIPGILVEAMQAGAPLLIDEMNLSDIPEWFNTVLDDRVLWLPDGTKVTAKKGFCIMGTINPPTAEYEGRVVLSPQLRSRFREIWVNEITDPAELQEIAEFMLKKANPHLGGAKLTAVKKIPKMAETITKIHLLFVKEFPKARYGIRQLLRVIRCISEFHAEMGVERSVVRAFELNYAALLPLEDKERFAKLTSEKRLLKSLWSVAPREIEVEELSDEETAEPGIDIEELMQDPLAYLASIISGITGDARKAADAMIAAFRERNDLISAIGLSPLVVFGDAILKPLLDRLDGEKDKIEFIRSLLQVLNEAPSEQERVRLLCRTMREAIEEQIQKDESNRKALLAEIGKVQARAGLDADARETVEMISDEEYGVKVECAVLTSKGQYDEALRLQEDSSLMSTSDRSDILKEIAIAQAQAGRYDEAKATAYMIKTIDTSYWLPDCTLALVAIAQVQVRAGLIHGKGEAKDTLDEAKSAIPERYRTLTNANVAKPEYLTLMLREIALCRAQAGLIEGAGGAQETFGEAIATIPVIEKAKQAKSYKNPQELTPGLLAGIAAAQAEAGLADAAQATLNEAKTRSSDANSALEAIARAEAQMGLWGQAEKTCGKISKWDMIGKTEIYIAQERAKRFLKDLKKNGEAVSAIEGKLRRLDEAFQRTRAQGSDADRIRIGAGSTTDVNEIMNNVIAYVAFIATGFTGEVRKAVDAALALFREGYDLAGVIGVFPLVEIDITILERLLNRASGVEEKTELILSLLQVLNEAPPEQEQVRTLCRMMREVLDGLEPGGRKEYFKINDCLEEIGKLQVRAKLYEEARETKEIISTMNNADGISFAIAVSQGSFTEALHYEETSPNTEDLLKVMAVGQARAKLYEDAKKTVRMIKGSLNHVMALIEIASVQAQAGTVNGKEEAIDTLDQAKNAISKRYRDLAAIDNPEELIQLLTAAAACRAQAGLGGAQGAFDETIAAVHAVADAKWGGSLNAGVLPPDYYCWKAKELARTAVAAAKTGLTAAAGKTLQEAESNANRIAGDDNKRDAAFKAVAEAAAQMGLWDRADNTCSKIKKRGTIKKSKEFISRERSRQLLMDLRKNKGGVAQAVEKKLRELNEDIQKTRTQGSAAGKIKIGAGKGAGEATVLFGDAAGYLREMAQGLDGEAGQAMEMIVNLLGNENEEVKLQALFALAHLRKRFGLAETLFDQLFESRKKDYARLHEKLALELAKAGDYDAAVTVALQADGSWALPGIAAMQVKAGKEKEAWDTADKESVRIVRSRIYCAIASAYYALEDQKDEKDYSEVKRALALAKEPLAPGTVEWKLLNSIALLEVKIGSFDDAVKTMLLAGPVPNYVNISDLKAEEVAGELVRAGEDEKARSMIDSLYKSKGATGQQLKIDFEIARRQMKEGLRNDAETTLAGILKTLNELPGNDYRYRKIAELAVLEAELGLDDRAKNTLEQNIPLRSRTDGLCALAAAYAAKGQDAKAEEYFSAAVTVAKQHYDTEDLDKIFQAQCSVNHVEEARNTMKIKRELGRKADPNENEEYYLACALVRTGRSAEVSDERALQTAAKELAENGKFERALEAAYRIADKRQKAHCLEEVAEEMLCQGSMDGILTVLADAGNGREGRTDLATLQAQAAGTFMDRLNENDLRKIGENIERVNKALEKVKSQGSAARKVIPVREKGVLYVGETRLPILDASGDNVPSIEKLKPVYVRSNVDMMEQAAMAVRAKLPILFVGLTALGKSFAIKVLAALAHHPYRATGMNPALTTYEMIGGYHPTGAGMPYEQACVIVEKEMRAAARSGNWGRLTAVCREIGVTFDQPVRSVRDMQQYLNGERPEAVKAVAVVLNGQKATLEWRDGFLVEAMRAGEWLVLEELNLASSAVIEVLSHYLVFGKLRILKEGVWVDADISPEFRLFATMNPEDYAGRQRLSRALTDKFAVVNVTISETQAEEELQQIMQVRFGLQEWQARQIVQFHMGVTRASKTWRGDFASKEPYEFNLRHLFRLGGRISLKVRQYAGMTEKAYEALTPQEKNEKVQEWLKSMPDREQMLALGRDVWEVYGNGIRDRKHRPALFALMGVSFGLGSQEIEQQDVVEYPSNVPDSEGTLSYEELLKYYGGEELDAWGLRGDAIPVVWMGGVPLLKGEGALAPTEDQEKHLIGDKDRIPIVETTRRYMGTFARSILRGEHLLLVGGTGVGKTSIVFEIFRQLHRPLYYINFHNGVNMDELVGGWQRGTAGGFVFVKGLLARAMEAGAPLCVDELNLSDMPEWFNTVLDDGILWMPDGTKVTAKPGFMVIGAINPPKFAGRNVLSPALRSRFHEVSVDEIRDKEEIAEIVLRMLNGVGKVLFGYKESWERALRKVETVIGRQALDIMDAIGDTVRHVLDAVGFRPRYVGDATGSSEKEAIEEFGRRAGLSDERMRELREKVEEVRETVQAVGIMVGQDRKLHFAAGKEWKWNYESNTITYPLSRILSDPIDVIIGTSIHEGSHRDITRVNPNHPVMQKIFSQETYRYVWNVFEDPRVNNWAMRKFSGGKHYLDIKYDAQLPADGKSRRAEMYEKSLLAEAGIQIGETKEDGEIPKLLPYMQYGLGVMYWWRHETVAPFVTDEDAAKALQKTSAHFKEIFEMLPETLAPGDKEKLQLATQAAKLVDEHIIPEYEKLLDKSRKEIEKMLQEQQQNQGQGQEQEQEQGQGQDQRQDQGKGIPEELLSKKAKKMLEENARGIADKLEGKAGVPQQEKAKENARKARAEEQAKGKGGKEEKIDPNKPLGVRDLIERNRRLERERKALMSTYQKYLEPVADASDRLRGILGNIFFKNARPKDVGWFRSGKPNIQKVMQSEAHGWMNEDDFKVFTRRVLPQKRDYRFSLVIDQSGSMDGDKTKRAMEGLTLFMEVLEYLGIDYNVIGFADAPSEYKEFGRGRLDEDQRNEIVVETEMAGGGGTNDKAAIAHATGQLKEQLADRKVMIVITDGEGTSGSIADELREARENGIEVIGIGIAEGMRSVKNSYGNNGIVVPDIDDLPETLGEVVENQLLGEPETSPAKIEMMRADNVSLNAILPENLPLVNRWANGGWSALAIALGIGLFKEFGPSYFHPRRFIQDHPDKRGAKAVVYSGIIGGIVSGLAVGIAALGMMGPFALAAAVAAGIIASIFVNVTVHVAIDWHYISASGLIEAVRGAGAATIDENGEVHTYVMNGLPRTGEDWGWKPTGMRVRGVPVWASTKRGVLVLCADGVPAPEVAAAASAKLTGKGNLKGSRRMIARFKELLRELSADARGIDLHAAGFRPGISIDHAAAGKTRTYTKDGMMVISKDLLSNERGELEPATFAGKLGEQMTIRDAEAVQCMSGLFFKSKGPDITAFVRNLETFGRTGNAQIIVTPEDLRYPDGRPLEAGKIRAITDRARKSGVQVFINVSRETYRSAYRDAGFAGYAEERDGVSRVYGLSRAANAFVEGENITGFKSPEELAAKLKRNPQMAKVIDLGDLEALLRGGERSFIGRVALMETVKTALLSGYLNRRVSTDEVRGVAGAWDRDRLPATAVDAARLVSAVESGNENELFTVLGAGEGTNAVRTYLADMERRAGSAAGTDLSGLRKVFLRAIAERMLAKEGLEALKKTNGLADARLEVLYGRMRYAQERFGTFKNDVEPAHEKFQREHRDVPADVSYDQLLDLVSQLSDTAGNTDDAAGMTGPRADAVNSLVELIGRLGEPRTTAAPETMEFLLNEQAVNAIISAA